MQNALLAGSTVVLYFMFVVNKTGRFFKKSTCWFWPKVSRVYVHEFKFRIFAFTHCHCPVLRTLSFYLHIICKSQKGRFTIKFFKYLRKWVVRRLNFRIWGYTFCCIISEVNVNIKRNILCQFNLLRKQITVLCVRSVAKICGYYRGLIKAQCGKTDGSFRKSSTTEWSKLQCQQICEVQNIFGSLENTSILIEETQLSVTDRQRTMVNRTHDII